MFSGRVFAAIVLSFAFFLSNANASMAEKRGFKVASLQKQTVRRSVKSRTMPPFAYIKFCVQNPGACKGSSGRLATKGGNGVLTDKLRGQLASVNSSVNRAIRPVNDSGGDSWKVNVSRGDCEDYVLTKRSRLISMGWPSRSLAIAVVRTQRGEGHAVLVVNTSQGKMVLDNLVQNVRPKSQSPHRFLSMQDPGSKYGWMKL